MYCNLKILISSYFSSPRILILFFCTRNFFSPILIPFHISYLRERFFSSQRFSFFLNPIDEELDSSVRQLVLAGGFHKDINSLPDREEAFE
jgi:hypothetical protein